MLSAAGIESFIMNMYRHIDREKIQFDFLVLRNQEEFYDNEIRKMGGKKYYVQSNIQNTWFRVLDEARQIEAFLKKHHYDIVHIHYTTPLRAPYLLAAKKAGVSIRIYHAHSAAVSGKSKLKLIIYEYYRKKIAEWGTDWFGCSKAAAEWIFPQKLIKNGDVEIVYNGIDSERFKYDQSKRVATREQLRLGNAYTVINTGRFIEQKNQNFVLEVFKKVKLEYPNSKLLLLGNGSLLEKIKEKAQKMNISEDVYFLGVKKNVEDYLCAADCYIMPSLYEGLPVAAVEAECNGLPCVMSKNITREVALTQKATFLSLDDPAERWAKKILSYRDDTREDTSEIIVTKGYDVKFVSKWLEKKYISRLLGEQL